MPRLELLSIRQHNPFTMPWRVDVCNGSISTYDVCVLDILSDRFVRHHPVSSFLLLPCNMFHPDTMPWRVFVSGSKFSANSVQSVYILP